MIHVILRKYTEWMTQPVDVKYFNIKCKSKLKYEPFVFSITITNMLSIFLFKYKYAEPNTYIKNQIHI